MQKFYEAAAHSYSRGHQEAGNRYYAKAQYWDAALTGMLQQTVAEAEAESYRLGPTRQGSA